MEQLARKAIGLIGLIGLLVCLAPAQSIVVNPGGTGGGSGTVGSCAAAGNAYYAASGTTTACDTSITDNGAGALTIAQAALAASTPFQNHTGTWNAGAVAFTDWFSNITCTAAAAASKAFDMQVGGASQLSLQYGAANCTAPVLVLPNGVNANPSLAFAANTTTGFYSISANQVGGTNGTSTKFSFSFSDGTFRLSNAGAFAFVSVASQTNTNNIDVCMHRNNPGIIQFDTDTACSNGSGFIKTGMTTRQSGSNFTTAATTATAWLTFPVFPASAQTWNFHCTISYQSSVNTAGMVLGISNGGITAPTSKMATAIIYTNSTGAASTFTTGSATDATAGSLTILSGGNVATGATTYLAYLDGETEIATAGQLIIQAWNTSAATLTILRGSYCQIF